MGHPFIPAFSAASGIHGVSKTGLALLPGKSYNWKLIYDPDANHGTGAITATLGAESTTLNFKKGWKERADKSRLDHFGIFSIGPGGQMVKIYLDDLRYTVAAPR